MITAEDIANQIIDKSYWGDQWFLFFCLLLVGLIAALSSWAGSYLTTKAQSKAIRADFERALSNLEKQTSAVKKIEEEISHNYLEVREVTRIKREKIEAIYNALNEAMDIFGHNLKVTALNTPEAFIKTPYTVETLISLYFKNELKNELECYREKRVELYNRLHELAKDNLKISTIGSLERFEENRDYIVGLSQSKCKIEFGLEKIMRSLTA